MKPLNLIARRRKKTGEVRKQAGKKKNGAETLGGIQSTKSRGFCLKKVRISSNKHHQVNQLFFTALG